MPFSGGTFTRPVSDYVFDTVISETDVNTEMDGIATGLTNCILKDGTQTTTALIPFAAGLSADTIAEKTTSNGVAVDGVTLKDGRIDTTQASNIASASSIDISDIAGNYVLITGTTTITALGTAAAGAIRVLRFAAVLTFTHNATSLILPGSANITTAAGDIAVMVSEGSGNWRCVNYARADGSAVTASAGGLSNVVEDTTPQLGGQLDVNGNAIGDGTRELLTFTEDASAVNHVNIENEATGAGPIISSAGDDANIDLKFDAKGTGTIQIVPANLDVTTNIRHLGDGDNLFAFGTDTQDFQTGGSSRMDISNSGVRLGGANARVTTVLDEDAMGSDSATALATQQSIKAYVDAQGGGWTYGTPLTPTGATAEFTSIPSTAKEIELIVDGLACATNNIDMELVLGDSGGYETTGYANLNGATTHIFCYDNGAGAAASYGIIKIARMTASTFQYAVGGSVDTNAIGGSKTLSAVIDRLRLEWETGASFSTGTVNIRYR